jgi:DNA-binding Lrp family transcriptional regulator
VPAPMRRQGTTWRLNLIVSINHKVIIAMLLDITDRKLLNLVQMGFPLCREPFAKLGGLLGVSEDEVLRRLQELKKEKIIRTINAVFESARMGYHSTLVAMHIEEQHVEQAANFINHQEGVSHNYLRNHYFNLWFTLSAPKDTVLDGVAAQLGEAVAAERTLSLPTRQVFKIMVYFDMLDERDGRLSEEAVQPPNRTAGRLSEDDKGLVRELQRDLPLEKYPFDKMAARLGLDIDQFLSRAVSLRERGFMRRFAARLNHREAGFLSNALSCWRVAPDKLAQVGQTIASYPQVSHCYERRTAPEWHYNIYAMVHGHNKEDCSSLALNISQETGIKDYVLLYSIKEYLRRSVKYFIE